MKTYFRRKVCENCHTPYDSIEKECPCCHSANRNFDARYPFEYHLRDAFPWQIAYFAIGWAGFQVLGIIIQLIVQGIFTSSHPGATTEEVIEYLTSATGNFAITGTAYGILLGVFILILSLRRKMPAFAKSFSHWLPYVVGLGGGLLLLGVSIGYNVVADALMKLANVTPSHNANENAVRAMVKAFPVLSVFIFGIVGPMCEEITYRVGLFGLTSRLGRVLAYIISSLVFAGIHFGWNALFGGTRDAIVIELINIPSYLIAGIGLALLYDRCGLCASFVAHATNNLVSVFMQIASGSAS